MSLQWLFLGSDLEVCSGCPSVSRLSWGGQQRPRLERERTGEGRIGPSSVYGWRFGWLPVAERVCLFEGQGPGRGLGPQCATPKGVPR